MIRVLEIGDRTLSVQYRYERPYPPSSTDPGSPGGFEIESVWDGLEVAETTDKEDQQIMHELSKQVD